MTPNTPLDAHRAAAERVFTNVNFGIAEQIGSDWDFAIGHELINRLTAFLQKARTQMGDGPFGFVLTQKVDSSRQLITPQAIIKANAKSPTLLVLNSDLRVLDTKELSCADPDSPEEMDFVAASQNTVVAHYESKAQVRFYAHKCTVGYISLDDPLKKPGRPNRNTRRPEDYELCIRDHYCTEVKYWGGTDHWHDRKTRKLRDRLGSAKTTEGIFHRSLSRWLEQHLQNTARVRNKAKDVTSDEPDIEIFSLGGKVYRIELKWLGCNAKGTTHGIDWLRDGVRQLNKYLEKRSEVVKGTLVTYDGRKEEEFSALECTEEPEDGCRLIEGCMGEFVSARGSSLVLFLKSKTASEA